MAQPKIQLTLTPQFSAGGTAPATVTLDFNETNAFKLRVGRGFCGFDAKRCSRQQLEFNFDSSAINFGVTRVGPNLSFIGKGTTKPEELAATARFVVNPGDVIYMLDGEGCLKIDAVTPSIVRSTSEPARTSRKRMRSRSKHSRSGSDAAETGFSSDSDYDDLGDDSEDEDEDMGEIDDFSESNEESDSHQSNAVRIPSRKRVCMYGTSCYRRNPQHFREFAHPWLRETREEDAASNNSPGARQVLRSNSPQIKMENHTSSSEGNAGFHSHGDGFQTTDDAINGAPSPSVTVKLEAAERQGRVDHSPSLIENRNQLIKKEVCQYGTSCYRRNPQHFREFAHPWMHETRDEAALPNNLPTGAEQVHRASSPPIKIESCALPSTSEGQVLSRPQEGNQATDGASNRAPTSSVTVNSEAADRQNFVGDSESLVENVNQRLQEEHEAANQSESDGSPTRLALPVLGLDSGGFDEKTAIGVATEELLSWASSSKSASSVQLSVFNNKADVVNELREKLNLQQTLIDVRQTTDIVLEDFHSLVIETSWRAKPASAFSQHVFDACASNIEKSLKSKCGGTLKVAMACALPNFQFSAGTSNVIAIVSPNISSFGADHMDDEEMASMMLAASYRSVLSTFSRSLSGVGKTPSKPDALSRLMDPTTSLSSASGSSRMLSTVGRNTDGSSAKQGAWANALEPYCRRPENFGKDEVIDYDDHFVTIRDKFPKAKYHYLVMPRSNMDGLSTLRAKDMPLLESLVERGTCVADRLRRAHPNLEFKTGFHALPSMRQLHLHVISQDFDSVALKSKKHWNSFTTSFFKDADKIVTMLRDQGSIEMDVAQHENMLKLPMKCHKCAEELPNIPKLKEHILKHI